MAAMLKVYYWPMLARGAPLVRMLEHTGTAYEYISDPSRFAEVCSNKGAQGNCFAPPVIVDGDTIISQSTAATAYLGNKLGLTPPGFDQFKAMQFMADIVDTFEGNLGKHNEQGPALKKFLEGDRFKALMGNLERGIVGPYYFGAEPSCVDFFLAAHMDWKALCAAQGEARRRCLGALYQGRRRLRGAQGGWLGQLQDDGPDEADQGRDPRFVQRVRKESCWW